MISLVMITKNESDTLKDFDDELNKFLIKKIVNEIEFLIKRYNAKVEPFEIPIIDKAYIHKVSKVDFMPIHVGRTMRHEFFKDYYPEFIGKSVLIDDNSHKNIKLSPEETISLNPRFKLMTDSEIKAILIREIYKNRYPNLIVRDIHYVTKKDETPFWKDLKNLELPDSLKNNLELWKNKLPIKEDFNSISNYTLFNNSNYILVMHGLNLFNREKIKNEYELIRDKVKIQADVIMERQQLLNNNTKNLLTHKKFLSLIRDNF